MSEERRDRLRSAGDRLPGEGTSLVVGAVVECVPGGAGGVALRLARIDGLRVVGDDGKNRIAVVWETPDARRFEREFRELVRSDEEILGIYPTFAGVDGEDGRPA